MDGDSGGKLVEAPEDSVRRYFASEKQVLLAYLFGSQADGTAGPQSDC
ncbi:MAG: nucleotidyltransferase domain-containing protein, partial [Anaerolineae bacterium]